MDREAIEYTLMHLAHHIDGFDIIKSQIGFGTNDMGINMPISHNKVATKREIVIDDVPILFPTSDSCEPYHIEDGKLFFHHDFIQSAFYILSGLQELSKANNFAYADSIQAQLQCIDKPIVNYYFNWIAEGIELYANNHNLKVYKRRPMQRMTLHLTHNIDTLKYYSFDKNVKRLLQAINTKRSDVDRKTNLVEALKGFCNNLNIARFTNPYWSIHLMRNAEKYFGFTSTWFFKSSDEKCKVDYALDEKAIATAIEFLSKENYEIGFQTDDSTNATAVRATLASIIPNVSTSTRASRLDIKYPQTLLNMQNNGFDCDCSLGFTDRVGFRFGYCLPFHPYDHSTKKAMKIWEVPLQIIDYTLLVDNNLTNDQIFESIGQIADEVRQFGGILSLLWHNDTFDEKRRSGILKLYEEIHLFLSQYSPTSLTTKQIIDKMNGLR